MCGLKGEKKRGKTVHWRGGLVLLVFFFFFFALFPPTLVRGQS